MKKSILLVMMLSMSSLLFAQRRTHPPSVMVAGPQVSQDQLAADAPDTTACSFSYSSGSGDNFTRYCLSVNGNIVQFDRPSGFEYIAFGFIGEGYGICDNTAGGVAYDDYAGSDSGNWGATTRTFPNATTAKFVRTTSDGIWTLTQTIKQVKANGAGPGSAKITMAVKNSTGIGRNIFLVRYADVDAGATTSDNFDQSKDAAFGNDNVFDGLSLTNNTFTFDHYAATWTTAAGPNPCNFNVNRLAAPAAGIDGSIGHLYALTVPAGATKTVNMTYKPY
jgi:hypothetical protein